MPTTLRSGATYDTLKPPATKRRRTGTKADARTSLTVRGDSSLLTLGAKGVTVGRGVGPAMKRLEVDWGEIGEVGYYGMDPHRAQALLRTLNPAMSFAINNSRHQFSTMSSGSFLRILFSSKDDKVQRFMRR